MPKKTEESLAVLLNEQYQTTARDPCLSKPRTKNLVEYLVQQFYRWQSIQQNKVKGIFLAKTIGIR